MGQKTNSNIFRLGVKNTEWVSKYQEINPEESTFLVNNDLEIRNYINRIFEINGLIINSCKIRYNKTNINIYVTYYVLEQFNINLNNNNSKNLINFLNSLAISLNIFVKNNYNTSIKLKTKNLNKKLVKQGKNNTFRNLIKKLRKFSKNIIFKDLINILLITVTQTNSSRLLSEFIAIQMKKNKKHNFFLSFLKKVLTEFLNVNFSKIKGIKIVINGRFNGAPRSRKKIIQLGSIPLQSFNSKISYNQSISYTNNGTFGINVWVCEK
uniref:ribosomal protein S3 n=1 Tax=Hemiaulus sinensis TaxID=1003062 RepID=UPI00202869BF|nr:ribosomal protein S3 [Hemiaulus sinensis]QYB23182.1 ribosomal protein S3 [Hemiaulus sinensis]